MELTEMKKYLTYLAVIFTAILSSCSNDDIPVKTECTIRVNPNTVISDFAEYDAGELTNIPNDYQLRVHLYVFDISGNKILSDVQYTSDYSHYITFKLNIPIGEFRILTTTDVVRTDGSVEYWIFSDDENLTRLKITKSNLVAEQRGILGYATKTITVNAGGELFEIDAKPAGALIFANVQNMKSIADVVRYDLVTNRRCESVQFNSLGEPAPSVESSNSMDWRTVIFNIDDLTGSYTGLYTYYFSLPLTNAKFEWHGITNENKYRVVGDSFTCSMAMGEEFDFEVDASTKETYWGQVDLSGSKSTRSFSSNPFSSKNIMPIPFANEQ